MKYVVVKEGWEYDDCFYCQSEDEGYTIQSKLFDTAAEAQVVADANNKECADDEWFREEGSDEPIQPYKVISIEE